MTPEEQKYQEKFNDRMSLAIEKLTETVVDLEKHTVIVEGIAISVRDHDKRLIEIERSMDFVKAAKYVFVALIIALAVGSATAIWQTVKSSDNLTKQDLMLLIEAVKN